MSVLRRFGARRDRAEPGELPTESFTRDLFMSRLARPAVAVGLVALGVLVAWLANAVGTPVGVVAAIGVTIAVLAALLALDRERWHGQDVVLWQQAGRQRRWLEETGGPSPIEHPAQAELWLGSHPRGTVPQVYRVMAAGLARDPVVHERELAAWVPATDAEAAWKAWAIAAPRAMLAEEVDLAPIRGAVDALPDHAERAQLEAALAVADALRLHAANDGTWLEPLLTIRAGMRRERLEPRRRARALLARVAILGSFLVPAVLLAASGIGTPEPYPRAYVNTTFATRGEVRTIDRARMLRALPGLAAQVGSAEPIDLQPLSAPQLNERIAAGLPTLIWHVDTLALDGPRGAACDHVWSIESLLGGDTPDGSVAIVTCDRERGPAYLVSVDPATGAALRAALGLEGADGP